MQNSGSTLKRLAKTEILAQYAFFHGAVGSMKQDLDDSAKFVEIERDSQFFQKGSNCEYVAFIGRGTVRVYVVGDCGREVTLYRVQPGESCPINILSAMLDKGTSAIAVAETDVQAAIIHADKLKEWVSTFPAMWQFILEAMASRLTDVFSLMEEIKFRKLEHRLAEYLISQFCLSDANPPVIKVTHERIASELGSAREVISRLLGEFERKGTIELARGRIYLSNELCLKGLITGEPERMLAQN